MGASQVDISTLKVGLIAADRAQRNRVKCLLESNFSASWAWTCANVCEVFKNIHLVRVDLILIVYPFPSQICFGDIGKMKRLLPYVNIILVADFIANSNIEAALAAGVSAFVFAPPATKLSVKSFAAALAKSGNVPEQNKAFGLNGNRTSPSITKREKEILGCVASGKSDKEIATMLGLSVLTINRHLHNIYTKHNVRNRTQAVGLLR